MNEKPALSGVVEELDRARVAVPGAQRQPLGGVHQLVGLFGGQRGAGGFLDHLPVAALIGAVTHPDRPRGALAVRDDLNLDVTRRADRLLHQQGAVTERLQRLAPGARERGRKRAELIDAADAAAATADRGLDHHRRADLLSMGKRLLDGRDEAAAPRRDRHPYLLRQPLGGDLVAHQAHARRVGTDEHDPEPFAQLRELRLLGDESPTHPRGIGPRGGQRPRQRIVVEVPAAAWRRQRF